MDNQNGGFTVFGQVTEGLDVVDAIANVPRYNSASFTGLPLRDWDTGSTTAPNDEHFVIIEQIVVLDAAIDTAADLNPKLTTRDSSSPTASPDQGKSGGAGLPLPLLTGLLLAIYGIRRKN